MTCTLLLDGSASPHHPALRLYIGRPLNYANLNPWTLGEAGSTSPHLPELKLYMGRPLNCANLAVDSSTP